MSDLLRLTFARLLVLVSLTTLGYGTYALAEDLDKTLSEIKTKSADGKYSLSPASLQKLKNQCQESHGEGCHRLAQFVAEANPESGNQLYLFSCSQGYGLACESYVAARAATSSSDAVLRDPELQKLIEKSCKVEQPVLNTKGCERFAEMLIVLGKSEQARPLLQKLAAISHDGDGKLLLAQLAEEGGETEFSCALRHAACRQNVEKACEVAAKCENSLEAKIKAIGQLPADDPSSGYQKLAEHAFKSGDLGLSRTYYDRLCKFGSLTTTNRQGEPWACHRTKMLAEVIANIETKLPELEKGCLKEAVEETCDELVGLYSSAGRYSEAAAITAKGCSVETDVLQFKGKLACLRHIELLEKANNLQEAKSLTSAFCVKGGQEMCAQQARLESQSGNENKAFEVASSACLSSMESCSLRDKILAKNGVEGAKKYYESHCEKDDPLSCLNLGIILSLQSNTEQSESLLQKALPLFEQVCKKGEESRRATRATSDSCFAVAAIYCFRGDLAKGRLELENQCKRGIESACKALEGGRCESARQDMLGDMTRRFGL